MSSPSWAQVLAKDSSQKVGEYRAILNTSVNNSEKAKSHPSARPVASAVAIEVEQAIAHEGSTSREFPSLSGAPQAQQPPTPSLAIWNNSGTRGAQQGPVQRPQGPTSGEAAHTQEIATSAQSRQPHQQNSQSDNQTSPFPHIGSNVDEFRFDEQASMGRLQRAPDRRESEDDFPPLGGLGEVDNTHLRRPGPGPNTTFAGLGGNNDFGPLPQQARNGILGRVDPHQDSLGSHDPSTRFVSPTGLGSATSRSPLEARAEDQGTAQRNEQLVHSSRVPPGIGQDIHGPQNGGLAFRPNPSTILQQQTQPTNSDGESQQSHPVDRSQMSDIDKWGLKGLMTTLRGENGIDQLNLALGMDLNNLGLDLHRPDNSPLYETWAGPFADPNARPLVRDFTLPAAYSVNNVPPLATKIGSFSDESLFAIFYQCPRDVAQDLAANELYNRDWRWHKRLQQWMMKAKELGEPVMLQSMKEERGWYYFFDVNNWRRERKEFILNYEHLHHVPQNA